MFTTFFILNHGVEALGALIPVIIGVGVIIVGLGFTALALLLSYLSGPTEKRARNLYITGGLALLMGFVFLTSDVSALDSVAMIFFVLGALCILMPSLRKPL